jgi:hypothetical protein
MSDVADPVLALIAAARAAEDNFIEEVRTGGLNDLDPSGMFAAEDAALCARPQTLEGAAAQLIFAAECRVGFADLYDGGVHVDADSLILVACVNAARAITGQEPNISEQLAKAIKAAEAWARDWRAEKASLSI